MIIQHDLSKLCVSLSVRKVSKKVRTQTMIYDSKCLVFICKLLKITKKQIFSNSRKDEIVKARYLFYWYLYHSTELKLSDIGLTFSKDHTNVKHGLNSLGGYEKEKALIKEKFNSKIKKR